MPTKTKTIVVAGYNCTFTANGAVQSEEYGDGNILNARALDRIVAIATHHAKAPKAPEDADPSGLDLAFHTDGSVSFGCTNVDYKTLIAAHKLSLAARNSKTK